MIREDSRNLVRLLRNALLLSLLAFMPMYVSLHFFWPYSTDLIFYANTLDMFSSQFWNGDVYPRWLEGADNHKGAPVFVFYAPLVFYVGSLWQFLAGVDPHGIARTLLTEQVFRVLSAFTCYYWLRDRLGKEKASISALIYAFFPYGLWLFYFTYQPAISACMAWLPMALRAVDLELEKRYERAAPLLISTICLLFLTHFLYTLILVPLIVCYAIFQASSNIPSTLRLSFSGVIGCAMAAVYWLTAIINKPHFDVQHLWTVGKFDAVDNLTNKVFLIFACALIGLPMVATLFVSYRTHKRPPVNRDSIFWCAVLAFSWFMATGLSQPLWEHITMLRYFQFPARFFILSIPAVVCVSSQLLSPKQLRALFLYFVVFVVFLGANYTRTKYTLFSNMVLPHFLEHHIVRPGNTMVGAEYATDLAYGHFDGGALPELVSLVALGCAGVWLLFLKMKYKKQNG